jgi:hypothetical protein
MAPAAVAFHCFGGSGFWQCQHKLVLKKIPIKGYLFRRYNWSLVLDKIVPEEPCTMSNADEDLP